MNESTSSKEQMGVILNPMNLLKTVGASFPFASSGVEIRNQLEGHETKKRIDSLESQVTLAAKIRALESASPSPPAPLHDWSIPADEYMRRTVDIAVVYDSGFHNLSDPGRKLTQPVAHGCIISEREILICSEAEELARSVAGHKNGQVVVLAGFAWYTLDPNPTEEGVGLSIYRLSKRDDEKWSKTQKRFHDLTLRDSVEELSKVQLKHTSSVWMGQELGFIHTGEATDVMAGLNSYSLRQFDTSTVSHFRKPEAEALKVAVTGVLSGRVCQLGSPVFSRDGFLIGLISDTENYESDAGRRAVIKTLLGLPRYTNFTKQASSETKS